MVAAGATRRSPCLQQAVHGRLTGKRARTCCAVRGMQPRPWLESMERHLGGGWCTQGAHRAALILGQTHIYPERHWLRRASASRLIGQNPKIPGPMNPTYGPGYRPQRSVGHLGRLGRLLLQPIAGPGPTRYMAGTLTCSPGQAASAAQLRSGLRWFCSARQALAGRAQQQIFDLLGCVRHSQEAVSATVIECDRPRLAVFLANHHRAGELVMPALLAAVKGDPENSQTQWQT